MKRMTTKMHERGKSRASLEVLMRRACSRDTELPDAVQVRRTLGGMKLSAFKALKEGIVAQAAQNGDRCCIRKGPWMFYEN